MCLVWRTTPAWVKKRPQTTARWRGCYPPRQAATCVARESNYGEITADSTVVTNGEPHSLENHSRRA